jgi:hypothetical protein
MFGLRSRRKSRFFGGCLMHRNLRRSTPALPSLLVILSSFFFPASAQEATPQQRKEIERQRADWFLGQRAYPHKYVPARARLRALRQLDQKLAAEAAARMNSQAGEAANPSWTSIGPQPIDTPYGASVVSGRAISIAIDPTNTNTAYLGASSGGAWKTTNAGANWTPLTDVQDSLATGFIALDPTNPSTVYVGTGEPFASNYGEGILKSNDGGSTWTHICGPFCGPVGSDSYYGSGARIGGLAVDPFNNQVLLAAVSVTGQGFKDGIFRSSDAGSNWTQVLSSNSGMDSGDAVIFDPANAGVAYAALGNVFPGYTEGIYKSTDGGLTWTAINTGLPLSNAGLIALAMAPSSTSTLYAGLADVNTGNLLGFFKTTNAGVNWTQLASTPDYCTPECNAFNAIGVQPTNPNVVYAGGAFEITLVRSLDGGNTWSVLQQAQQNGTVHADMHAIVFTPDGNTLYLANDGGAYSTNQVVAQNPAFTQLNSTLDITQFYPGLSINPQDVGNAIGGTQDNGTNLYAGSVTWHDVTCGDGGYTAIDFVVPTTMYAACSGIFIQKSTAGGTAGTWNLVENGINTNDRSVFIPPVVMDPSQNHTLYFGSYRIYQTIDGANTWSAISPDLTNGSGFWAVITSIAVAPTDSSTVYAGTGDDHVQVTTNAGAGAGATWTDRSAGLPPRVLTYVAVDPTTSTTAYATFSGFTGFGDSLGHVFKTTNGGATWTDISSDLPNIPVNVVLVDPNAPNSIFVASDIGVFYTTTGGTSWTSLVNGLPRVQVLGLTLHNASRTLRASTYGRGVWDINIASLLPVVSITSISPSSTVAGGPTFTLTVNGVSFDHTSVVQWNGSSLATTFVNSAKLTATVSAGDIAVSGTFQITVFNSSTNETSNSAAFTVNNPVPAITSLVPSTATAGGAAFNLTVKGSNFVNGSMVQWNGSSRTTTFVNSGQLTAAVTAADLALGGTAQVTVVNAAPGGGASNALTFTILNPAPSATSLSPASKLVGGTIFTLIVQGSNFVKGATVRFNGNSRNTSYVSSSEVKASILAGDISKVGVYAVTVTNPTPGGGISNSLNFMVEYPAPRITSLNPPGAIAGGPAFALVIRGSNFFPQSVVNWNGSPRTTTFVNSTELKASITAADIAKAQNARVSVTNPTPGGGTASVTFVVENPVPSIRSISPTKALHGGSRFTLTVNGSKFVSNSVVRWNGSNQATTFVSSTQVTASIPASDIASPGTAQVTVFNTTPGGGTSNTVTFTIQ